jgi:hypothetical protein
MAILDLTNHCTGWILVVHSMQHLTGFLFYKTMEHFCIYFVHLLALAHHDDSGRWITERRY